MTSHPHRPHPPRPRPYRSAERLPDQGTGAEDDHEGSSRRGRPGRDARRYQRNNGLVRERLRLIPHEQKREHLFTLTRLIEAGKLTPVLDRTYPLADTVEGLRRVEQGHARGKVVITVA